MTIHQKITINCSANKIYHALTNAADFAAATGAPADIDAAEGGTFSCFAGQISGRNIELHDDQLIVQEWRVAAWPDGVYSTVRIELEPDGDATSLTLDQEGYPEEAEAHLDGGWHKMYWEPLRKYCE